MDDDAKVDDARVRAALDQLGVNAVRAKLSWMLGVSKLGQQELSEEIADGLWATRRQIEQWLAEKDAAQARWVKVGTWAGIIAAIAAIAAALFAYLAWRGMLAVGSPLPAPPPTPGLFPTIFNCIARS